MSLGSQRALRVLFSACFASALATGCGNPPVQHEPARLDPALEADVLGSVPSNIQHRLFIDFGGKVHLLGYDIDPEGVVAPGHKVKLTMYWASIAPLQPGWQLFTHILDARGHRAANIDNVGALRKLDGRMQALPPGKWRPGKVYVDEQDFDIPSRINSPSAIVTVGIWRPGMRLEVLSGPADKNRAIVVHIKTGLAPQAPASKKTPEKSREPT